MSEDYSVVRKRQSSPVMDASSRRFKEQKTQHIIADQDVIIPSAMEEEFESQTGPIPGVIQGSGDHPSTELPEHLHHLQRTPTYYIN